MRIVAGAYGGRSLRAPVGGATRPTSDRVREALFSALGDIEGARVLDLFAGTGALGLEALSRGAASADLVDRAESAAWLARANAEALGAPAVVHRREGLAFLRDAAVARRQYDLLFLDPPYREAGPLAEPLAAALAPVLAPAARVVCESDRRASLRLGLPVSFERRYGDTLIVIHSTSA